MPQPCTKAWPEPDRGRDPNPGMPPEGVTHAIGSRKFMATFFETHHKLDACYAAVEAFEAAHSMQFDWVVRMRPDIWFFDTMPPHCTLQAGAISFPVGVTGCGYSPCVNDHMAFTPRSLASSYFQIVNVSTTAQGQHL